MIEQTIHSSHIDNAMSKYREHIFEHPKAESTFKELTAAVSGSNSPQIIILTGPTGVGKSTLGKAIRNRLMHHYSERMEAEPDFVPIVSINAVPPEKKKPFNWKNFHFRLLTGQNEPLSNRKLVIPKQRSLFLEHELDISVYQKPDHDALRLSVESYLRLRRTKLLIIDEAHHILLGKEDELEFQFETLKSLSIETGVTLLLIGTYRLLDILDQSGQLTRRSQVIHYPRYDKRNRTDRDAFRKALVHLERILSVHIPTRLDEQAEYFYQKSAGCIGILKDWLGTCLEAGLREKATIIDRKFAHRFALKTRGLLTIVEEAILGEDKLADVSDDRLLDLYENGLLLTSSDPNSPRKRQRPGQRKPKRDLVGQAYL